MELDTRLAWAHNVIKHSSLCCGAIATISSLVQFHMIKNVIRNLRARS
jgi:hypothetical protein